MSTSDIEHARRDAWRDGIAALLIYLVLSMLFFGRALVRGFSSFCIGNGPDVPQFIWFLQWWTHALSMRLNPLMTHLIWVPEGFDMAWTTNVPLAGFLMSPFTKWLGPVAAYNILSLLCPVLAGWAAFALCRRITKEFPAALFGGLVFGFSPYLLCGLGELHLALVAAPPLAVYLTVRALERSLRQRTFVLLLALVLAAQFLLFIEVFATMTLSAAIAIILALLLVDEHSGANVRALIPSIVASYTLALVIVAPYLYYLFAFGFPHGPIWPARASSIDLLNFLIPVPTSALGTFDALRLISGKFRAWVSGGYLGLTLVIAIAIGRRQWREPTVRLLIVFAAVISILAMGPRMQVAGRLTIPLPWIIAKGAPLLNKALPLRLTVYLFLALAVLCAMWFSTGPRGGRWRSKLARGAAAALVAASLLPNLSANFWVTQLNTPPFFSTGLYRSYLKPGETVVILPYGFEGDGMMWQARSAMYFRMAGGYVGFAPQIPDEYARWPIVHALYYVTSIPAAGEQFKAFLKSHNVGAVIFADRGDHFFEFSRGSANGMWRHGPIPARDRQVWEALLGALGVAPRKVGGVTLYELPPELRARWPSDNPVALQQRLAAIQFPTLLSAAHRYVAGGGSLSALNPLIALQAGLLPPNWVGGPLVRSAYEPRIFMDGLLLGRWDSTHVVVGVEGSYPALKPLIEKYGPDASAVYFPFLQRFSAPPSNPADPNPDLMMMVFSPDGLARATAASASSANAVPHGAAP
jgi:hypothetical protein